MKTLNVRLTLTEEMLGMSPASQSVYADYIASNAPDAKNIQEEIETIGAEAVTEKSMTIFPKDENGNPFLWDYQIKGFFKDTCSALQKCKGAEIAKESLKIKAFKKIIDGCIFVNPRKIIIAVNGEMSKCERPLRASTPQGERVALACSEAVPAGSEIEFTVEVMSDDYEAAVREWLNYGRYRGLGQWRNSGKGRFTWTETE